jgi:hypothetical protein
MTDHYDVIIFGKFGFFTIHAATKRARAWFRRHVQGYQDGRCYSDCTPYVQDLVKTCVGRGYTVRVNGVDMAGYGQ